MRYYTTTLSGDRLERCYELASARVRQYLSSEAHFLAQRIQSTHRALELGCGYGRVMSQLLGSVPRIVGIDASFQSLAFAPKSLRHGLVAADALRLPFSSASFDVVLCVQNGICAFHVPPASLLAEALRVVRSPGSVLVSTYSENFWPHRLEWFRLQAAEGLVGPLDERATQPGTIVCQDGFSVGTLTPNDIRDLCSRLGVTPVITEVDGSSLFCEIVI